MNGANWYKIASQTGWTDTFGDIQRYALDPYKCEVYLTKTDRKITVSVNVAHEMYGLVVFQDFWKFSLGEGATAKTVYGQVIDNVKRIFHLFESSETPNNMLHANIREAVRYISPEHKPSTRIPFIDAARHEKGEHDWRSSIYGTRYPHIDGF